MAPNTVLLFFQDYERDRFFPNDRYLKRLVRPAYNLFRTDQAVSGFLVWYQNLVKALRLSGFHVELNNHRLAEQHPTYPVGLVGYPTILDNWRLPNPAILGPGMLDHPQIRPTLMQDPRFKLYIVTCQWVRDVFERAYGSDCCVPWFAGIDTRLWTDTEHEPQSVDVLIYDKIRWNRDQYEPLLVSPIMRTLEQLGLSYQVIRYRQYNYSLFRQLLGKSRSMIFLCEHETQGLAYQEALASNVPILAWNNGFWLDPARPMYDPNPVPACSVPYFSSECGMCFRDIDQFYATFPEFWRHLDDFTPRQFVERELSLAGSAKLYMKHYTSLLREPQPNGVTAVETPL